MEVLLRRVPFLFSSRVVEPLVFCQEDLMHRIQSFLDQMPTDQVSRNKVGSDETRRCSALTVSKIDQWTSPNQPMTRGAHLSMHPFVHDK